MSQIKTEVQIATISEIGTRIEDLLEAAKFEMRESRGIEVGMDLILRKVEQFMKALDGDFISQPSRVSEEEYRISKKCMARMMAMVQEMIEGARAGTIRCQGKVGALDQTVKMMSAMHATAQKKLDVPEAVMETVAPPLRERQEGTHPGNPLAQLKKESEQEESEAPRKPKRRKE